MCVGASAATGGTMSMFGGPLGIAGLGLQLLPQFMGGGKNAAIEQYKNQQRQWKRAELAMRNRRRLAKVQYWKQVDLNLDSASKAWSENQQKFQQLYGDFRQKELDLYVKTTAYKGTEASKGMLGKTAKRIEKMRTAKAGRNYAGLAAALTSNAWELDRRNKTIWSQYKSANNKIYSDLRLGQYVGSPGPMPVAPRTPNKWPGIFGTIGSHLVTTAVNKPTDPLADPFKNLFDPSVL